MATIEDGIPESNTMPVLTSAKPKQKDSSPSTAEARAESIRAKKKRRRAAHRITLRSSHTKG